MRVLFSMPQASGRQRFGPDVEDVDDDDDELRIAFASLLAEEGGGGGDGEDVLRVMISIDYFIRPRRTDMDRGRNKKK